MAKVECTCQQCGKSFLKDADAVNRGGGKFCSRGCSHVSFRRQVICECQTCHKKFTAKQYKKTSIKYCSKKCMDAARTNRTSLTCKHCGIRFMATPSQIANGRQFCSTECTVASRSNKIECQCQQCGNTFRVSKSQKERGEGKFCSYKCAGIANRSVYGKITFYGEDWYRQRKLAYERDGGVCQCCHRKPRKGENQFAVHHIVKRRKFTKDDPTANALSNLITLCPQCHPKAERGKIAVPVRLF